MSLLAEEKAKNEDAYSLSNHCLINMPFIRENPASEPLHTYQIYYSVIEGIRLAPDSTKAEC